MTRFERITAPTAIERAEANLERIIARWEAKHGRSIRDPEPTEAEIAEARARADEAVRRLIGALK